MITTTMHLTGSRSPRLGQVGRLLAVAVVTTMAVFGIVVAAWQIQAGPVFSGLAAVGETVDTNFGSFTVTRTSETFVPDTQGPPTAAQHVGANGADQLQVWVRFVNSEAVNGAQYNPERFRLVHASNPAQVQLIAGSSLTADRLRLGTSIEGQVWFELAGLPVGRYRLEYAAPGGEVVKVALGRLDPTVVTDDDPALDPGERSSPSDDPHEH